MGSHDAQLARSHRGGKPVGLLAIHGFTGTPASIRPVVDAAIAADVSVEAPLLSGHGTDVNDMIQVGWDDWVADVEGAAARLADSVDRIVVFGQSMGGALALHHALTSASRVGGDGSAAGVAGTADVADVVGVVLVNPLTQPRSPDEMELIDDLIEDGIEVVPGEGSDIADPEAFDVGYEGTPLRSLRSALVEGIGPLSTRYAEISIPALVYTSIDDHVVEPSNSEALVSQLGGPVEHIWLERSFHVATIDFDRHKIVSGTMEFMSSVTP